MKLLKRPVAPPWPETATTVPPALCSMPYGSASTVNRYVTPSGPSMRPVRPSTIREHETPRAEDEATAATDVTTSVAAALMGMAQRSARHGEQFRCNRAELRRRQNLQDEEQMV